MLLNLMTFKVAATAVTTLFSHRHHHFCRHSTVLCYEKKKKKLGGIFTDCVPAKHFGTYRAYKKGFKINEFK